MSKRSTSERTARRGDRKRAIHRRYDYTCQYCAVTLTPETATIDHVQPISRGGGDTSTNLVTACHDCNRRKGDRTPAEARMPLLTTVGILRGGR